MQSKNSISTAPVFNSNALAKVALYSLIIGLVVGIGLYAYTSDFYWLALPVPFTVLVFPFLNIRSFFFVFAFSFGISVDISITEGGLSLALPDEGLMIFSTGILTCLLIQNKHIVPRWFWENAITLIVFLQLIWTIIAVIFAQDLTVALKFLIAKIWFIASCFIFPSLFIKSKKEIIYMGLLIFIPVIIHSFVAFGWHYFLDFGYRESNEVVIPFYKNHVDYGTVLAMGFILVFITYLFKRKSKQYAILLIGLLAFLSIALWVASSRGAILSVIFSFVLFFAIKIKKANWILPLLFIGVLSIIFFLQKDNKYLEFRPNMEQTATQETFTETIVGAFTGKDMSSMERFYRWIASIRMSTKSPIVGVGPNNWYYHYKPHTVTSFRTWVSRNPEKSTTHNYFILMLTEQGIPAMILYGLLMMVLFAKVQKLYHKFTDFEYKHITLAIGMLLASIFINNFFSEFLETHKVGGIFFFCLSILVFLEQISKKNQEHCTN